MRKLFKFKIEFIRKNPILSSYISFVKGVLITLILCSLLSSCGTYQIHSVRKQPEIKSILAITSAGDTIQVSTDYLYREFNQNPYNYSNWRFYWDNSWYWGNGWYNLYDPYWRLRINRYNPYNLNPRIRVPRKVEVPQRYRPVPNRPNRVESATPRGSRTPQIQPNRGRTNQQPRTPQYNRPTRTQTTPNVQQRTNVGRGNTKQNIKQ